MDATKPPQFDLDSPEQTILHGSIIQKKLFLRKLYVEYYQRFKKAIEGMPTDGCFVELGSGGGFINLLINRTNLETYFGNFK